MGKKEKAPKKAQKKGKEGGQLKKGMGGKMSSKQEQEAADLKLAQQLTPVMGKRTRKVPARFVPVPFGQLPPKDPDASKASALQI